MPAPVAQVGGHALGQAPDAGVEHVAVAPVAAIAGRPGWLLSGSTCNCSASAHHSSIISLQLVGLLGGEVDGLGEVLGDVVQLPHVVVERPFGVAAVVGDARQRVEHDRLPPVVVERPRAEHLVVLRDVVAGCVGVGERRGEAHALDRASASTPLISAGGVDADERRAASAARRWRGRTGGGSRPSLPRPAGQCTMSGSATPPSCVSRFHRLSGVLPAHAQPQG